MAPNDKQKAARARIASARLEEAEALAARVRAGDRDAARDARRAIREGPLGEVRAVLQSALAERPRRLEPSAQSQPVPAAPTKGSADPRRRRRTEATIPPPRQLVYVRPPTRLSVEGRLRRNGTGWVIEGADGCFYAVGVVDEGQPGRLVGRRLVWMLRAPKHRVIASVKGEAAPWSEAREVLGGSPGQGKNRRH